MQASRMWYIYCGYCCWYFACDIAPRMDVLLDNLRITCIDLCNLEYYLGEADLNENICGEAAKGLSKTDAEVS